MHCSVQFKLESAIRSVNEHDPPLSTRQPDRLSPPSCDRAAAGDNGQQRNNSDGVSSTTGSADVRTTRDSELAERVI